jgi:2-dehydropantoate 2-reductase
MTKQNIAVIGLGAVGGVAAAVLQLAGRHHIIACARRLTSPLSLHHADSVHVVPLQCVTDPAEATPVDWILLCTKAQDTSASSAWLERLAAPGTRIAVLQNGLGHPERVAPFVLGLPVVPVIVYYNGERLGPDAVRLRRSSEHDIVVADDQDGRAFSALFAGSMLRALPEADFTLRSWRKLLLNITGNTLTAITRQRGHVLRRPDVHALGIAMLKEAIAVGRAEGVPLSDDEAAATWALMMTYPPDSGSSMYHDAMAGRPLETEALTGAVVRAGERHGIPTALNFA